MQREQMQGRVFPLDELDGFYVGSGICLHLTLEGDDTLVLDLFDDEAAAQNPYRGEVIRSMVLNLKSGDVAEEA